MSTQPHFGTQNLTREEVMRQLKAVCQEHPELAHQLYQAASGESLTVDTWLEMSRVTSVPRKSRRAR